MADKAFVGKCGVKMCAWNKQDDCMAPSITVEKRMDQADCDTYLNEEEPWTPQE